MALKVCVFLITMFMVCCFAEEFQTTQAYGDKVTEQPYMGPSDDNTIAKRSVVVEGVPFGATYNGNSWGAEVARSLAAAREAHDIVHAAYLQAKTAKDAALHHHSVAVAKELSALQAIKKNEEAAREARERAAEAQQKAIEAQTFYATARARAAAAQKIAAAREAAAAKALEYAVLEQARQLRVKDVENAKKAALRSSEHAGAISAAEYSAGHAVLGPRHVHPTILRPVYPFPPYVVNAHHAEWPVL